MIYYTYDANFLGYFGSNGVATVDSAFAIMNKAFTTNPVTGQYLTNGVDSFSAPAFRNIRRKRCTSITRRSYCS